MLVIGGGITGVGIALDAAARGFSVALVEKDDFAPGTSGRSSRLVHGGMAGASPGHAGAMPAPSGRLPAPAGSPHR